MEYKPVRVPLRSLSLITGSFVEIGFAKKSVESEFVVYAICTHILNIKKILHIGETNFGVVNIIKIVTPDFQLW